MKLHISRVRINDFTDRKEELNELFGYVPHGRFMTDRRFDSQKGQEFELSNLEAYLNIGQVYLAKTTSGDVQGIIGFNFSEWDTAVFDIRIALLKYFLVREGDKDTEVSRTLLATFHQWATEEKISAVIARLDTRYFKPVLTLQQEGYIIYECITHRSLDLHTKGRLQVKNINYRFARESDREQLMEIAARNTFAQSHFYLDTKFEKSKIDIMYSTWMDNALKSDQRIVVLETEARIAGIFIYDIQDHSQLFGKKIAIWKSALVDQRFRGKGIGRKLFDATLHACLAEGADIIDTSLAEKNLKSQYIHEVMDFRLISTQYTFHKWF